MRAIVTVTKTVLVTTDDGFEPDDDTLLLAADVAARNGTASANRIHAKVERTERHVTARKLA